jgi:two-component system, sensor histidine kinase and response regulator
MNDFDKALFEGTMVALCKILSKYNAFAQGAVMRDVGRDLIGYLKQQGFWFEEKGTPDDIGGIVEVFLQHGFAKKLEVMPAPLGNYYIWHDLALLSAYKTLQDVTENPFLSCPLNLCLSYMCDKHGKVFKLHEKTFDMETRVTTSQWELADKPPVGPQGFDPMVIENARLYELAEERAAALAEQSQILQEQAGELEKARQAAVEATRLKSEFLAHMSHEIRTLMNGVVGMAALLHQTRLDQEQHEYVETITRSGEALLDIINQILDLSKIEAGKLELEEVDLDLRSMFEDIVDLLYPKAAEKHLVLAGVVASRVPRLLCGDPVRLRQVLLNLVGNALKFTSAGQVILRAEAVGEDEGGVEVRISVTDTGVGISPEQQKRLFRPFSQADRSTARFYGGTGLGLSISRRLVEAMGGRISLESEPGKGSTFAFTVRLAKASVKDSATAHPQCGGRALVVADRPAAAEVLVEYASACGLSVRVARPEQAIRALDDGSPFDLAFIDWNGQENAVPAMISQLRAASRQSDLRVLLMGPAHSRAHTGTAWDDATWRLSHPVHQSDIERCLAGPGPDAADSSVAPPQDAPPPKPREEIRILVVEDNPINQRVALKILEKLGYGADLASNGREAVEACSRKAYDVVLMDCQMPEMDGFEATAELRRRDSGTLHTRIIAMTAAALEGDRERCLAAGMDDYLLKPFRPAEIEQMIERWRSSPAGESALEAAISAG